MSFGSTYTTLLVGRHRKWKERRKVMVSEDNRLKHHFESVGKFLTLMDLAESNATDSWQIDFIAGMQNRFDNYGMDGFCSEAQKQTLEKIAEETNERH